MTALGSGTGANGFAARPAATPGPSLTPRELEVLTAYARIGHQRLAAREIGISGQTFKNYLTSAYATLDVGGAIEAFRAMGWLRPPERIG